MSNDLTIILILMFLCHLLADYPLQGWLAQAKSREYWRDKGELTKDDWIMALLCHSMMWGIMIYLPIIFIGETDFEGWTKLSFWLTLPVNICVHMVIDHAKANEHKINLLLDQMFHFVQIVFTWALYILYLALF